MNEMKEIEEEYMDIPEEKTTLSGVTTIQPVYQEKINSSMIRNPFYEEWQSLHRARLRAWIQEEAAALAVEFPSLRVNSENAVQTAFLKLLGDKKYKGKQVTLGSNRSFLELVKKPLGLFDTWQ